MQKFILLLASLFIFASCSESISKPNFQFRSGGKAGVAAKFGDVEISDAELMDGIESEVYEAEQKLFDVKYNKLRSVVMQKLMDKDPNKKNLSNDEYLEKYIAKGVSVSEGDIDAFIKKQQIPAEHLNPRVREKIKGYLEMEKRKEAMDKWLAQQTAKTPVEVYLSKPRRPSFDVKLGDAPVTGGKSAKVTIVEFSDFQCPFCSKGAEVIHELKKKYGDKIQVAFKNFPLPFHNQAEGAAVAALCAKEQSTELFWKMHDSMFAAQDKLDVDSLKALAKKIGAKSDSFDKCLTENKYLSKVKSDIEEGKALKVKSTPTFFINGQLINGAQPLEVFSEIIDDELSK
ncbi:MAG: DsbA family protein [Bacteriovoracaceae bacterium]|nr:DsbA family protein [Bacteriovoracaceae bacterium]